MNAIDAENAAALTEVYETDLVDPSTGKQAESLEIDGKPINGTVTFDAATVDLLLGGTKKDVTAAVDTLKAYFPGGQYPVPFKSRASLIVAGRVRNYQVRQLNGENDNRATLVIGLARENSRK